MTEKNLQEQYQYVQSLLKEKRLKEALDTLKSLFWDTNIDNRLTAIRTPYEFMLQYMLDGMEDPQRSELYNKLIKDTLNLTDNVFIEALDAVSYQTYHTLRNSKLETLNEISYHTLLKNLEAFADELAINKLYNDSTKIAHCLNRHEDNLEKLFLKSWLTTQWSNGDLEEATTISQSTLVLSADLALMVSAVTLGLAVKFDEKKMDWLIETYQTTTPYIKQRVLVSLVIVAAIQHERITHYPNIGAKLSFLLDDEQVKKSIQNIYLQLLQSQETEKVDKKMREEIIPEMLKSATSNKNLKFGFEDGEESDEFNPDWSDAMEDPEFNNKIKEISDLQKQGADVYMSSFASLKGYPFFNDIKNWFYPFDKRHSSIYNEFGEEDKKGSILDLVFNTSLFCNSDKYSFCFTIQHIPKEQREATLSQLAEEQMGGLEAEERAMKSKELALEPSQLSNQYIQDLYRFYKLYKYRGEFKSIFSMSLNLYQNPLLKQALDNPEFLLKLAEFFLKKEYYSRAIKVYNRVDEFEEELSAETYQKLGFCFQKLKNYTEATAYFIKADMLKPDTLWTNRHLATCYRHNGDFKKALQYYEAVEKVQPENLSILFYIGLCYSAMEMYNEALQYFFKMDFIKEGDKQANRAIGWTSFLLGNLEQAEKYYSKIVEQDPLAVDHLNAGHISWAQKRVKDAVNHYQKAIELYDSKSHFIQLLQNDKPQLLKHGIKEDDIPLILDLLDN